MKGKRRKTGAGEGKPRPEKQPKLSEPAHAAGPATVKGSQRSSTEGTTTAMTAESRPTVGEPPVNVKVPTTTSAAAPPPSDERSVKAAGPTPPMPVISPATVADLIDLDFTPAASESGAVSGQVDPGLFDRPLSPSSHALPPPLRPLPPMPLVDLRPPPSASTTAASDRTSIWGAWTGPGEPTALEDAAMCRLVGDVLADEGFLPFVERLERALGGRG